MENNVKSKFNSSDDVSNSDSGFMESSLNNSIINEHDEIALRELNNRFAKYVEYVRETESNKNKYEELLSVPSLQLTNIKKLFEEEIKDLRNALDLESNNAAKLRINICKLQAENSNLENELRNKSLIVDQLSDDLNKIQADNEVLKTKICLLQHSKNDSLNLSNQLKECQNQLEMEVLLRTSAENACMTYKEANEFNETVSKEQLTALMLTHKNTIDTLTRLHKETLPSNLLEQMEEARRRLRNFLNDLRYSIDENLWKRIENLSQNIKDTLENKSTLVKDNMDLSANNTVLLIELEKLKECHITLENQLVKLESLHQEEINKLYHTISTISSKEVNVMEDDVHRLYDMNQSMTEKVLLDSEIKLYRKMIESEEHRTNFNRSPEKIQNLKRKKINHEGHSHSQKFSISNDKGKKRTVLKASRHKSCNVM